MLKIKIHQDIKIYFTINLLHFSTLFSKHTKVCLSFKEKFILRIIQINENLNLWKSDETETRKNNTYTF